ncbi:MAG: hypothetical protein JXD18_13390, partial [Anaerolineae bacterium]|nr:hypothetical protein [Anaerolineae bacterium]
MSKSILLKALLVFALLNILMCPVLFVLGAFAPQALGFLSPVLCPPGMHLDSKTRSQSDLRGDVVAVNTICTDGDQEVDATGRMLVILFGLPILGVILLVVWALLG